MMSPKVWVPKDEVKWVYAFMHEYRNGVQWILVSVDKLSDEQKAKWLAKESKQ